MGAASRFRMGTGAMLWAMQTAWHPCQHSLVPAFNPANRRRSRPTPLDREVSLQSLPSALTSNAASRKAHSMIAESSSISPAMASLTLRLSIPVSSAPPAPQISRPAPVLLAGASTADMAARHHVPEHYKSIRFTQEQQARLNKVLSGYVGTHNFHNYTVRVSPDDPAAMRYILSFKCEGTMEIQV